MANFTTFAGLANQMDRYQQTVIRIPSAQAKALRTAGQAIFAAEAAAATGGDGRLSNVGANGAALGVKTSVTTKENASLVTFKASGPWQLVEYPIKPHVIASKRYTGPRKGRGERVAAGHRKLRAGYVGHDLAAIRTPYGPRMYVNHPGVKVPKRPWSKGEQRLIGAAPGIAYQAAYNALHRTAG